MSQLKVVELNIEGNRGNSLPPIIHTVRQQSKKQLNELLQNLFNNTDDALFELADRSRSDEYQEMYFDSMRLIRLHRKEMSKIFMDAYYDSYGPVFAVGPSDNEPDDQSDGEPDYELLDQDELEMTVAVSGIVSKVTSQYSLPVMQLTKRFDSLANSRTITERVNPLGPYALSTAFAETLAILDVNIQIRIILMKLFERFVMERMGAVYETANQALIDADVLPDLKRGPSKANKSPTRARAVRSTSAEASLASGTDNIAARASNPVASNTVGFTTVQSLLAGIRGPGDGLILPTLESVDLIQALSHLQSTTVAGEIDIDRIPELGDVKALVLAQSGQDKKSLGQADDDTVNFVGMLFDYILNDRNLAIPMKALIGRLQIPIVKLAIIDKSFFEKGAHPARTLLNELSSAGIGWSGAQELKRDNLYNKIESVVLRVLNDFNDNPGLFSELVDELRRFVNKYSRRSVLVEQRVKESEAGKAKTHEAKLQVQALVNQKACGLRLPAEVGKFISDIWSRVLTLHMVKFGETSLQWTNGVAALDDLLWALQPLSELADVEKRDAWAAESFGEIASGMADLGCPTDEIEQFQCWLTDHLRNLSENDRAYLEDEERPQMNVREELIEEIVLASPTPEFDESSIEPECAATLKSITEGTWVDVKVEQDRELRCKLATISQPGDNYIFVNRRGMKVLERNRGQLAELVLQDELKLIDESQVFDRALQSVISNLRQMQQQRKPQ